MQLTNKTPFFNKGWDINLYLYSDAYFPSLNQQNITQYRFVDTHLNVYPLTKKKKKSKTSSVAAQTFPNSGKHGGIFGETAVII